MQELPVKEYLHLIWKRRKMVLIFVVSVMVLTTLLTLRQPKIYRAVTVVEIGAETPDAALFQDVVNMSPYYGWWSALRYYETQLEIVKSRSLLAKAAQTAVDKKLVRDWTVGGLTGHLQANLTVGSDEKSRLARIYFEDDDPERARILSNLIADTYAEENLTKKLSGISQAVEWLNQRLAEIRKEKQEQEKQLQHYMEEYRIVRVENREDSSTANVVALTDTLNRLKSNRIEIEAQYRKLGELVRGSKASNELLGVVSSELLTKLKVDLAELRAEESQLAYRYMEKHPRIVRIRAHIQEIERSIRQEVENEVTRLKTKFLLAKAEEDSIAKALETQKLEALRIDQLNRRLVDIQVVTDTNQKIYENLQRKIKEADLSALVRSNNVRVVDPALLPSDPVRPVLKNNMMLALIIGLLGGVGLALGLEYMDDTFKTPDDVERYLRLPLLSVIPKYAPQDGNGAPKTLEFIPYEDPTAAISEFYRTLRTNVLFLTATKGLKRILVVSTGPGEGKTVTAVNLAVTLAQAGEKTILLDLDLRRPKLHHAFETENRLGITNLLVGDAKFEDVVRSSRVPNLHYVVAGTLPPNPAELIGSKELKQFLDEASQRHARVIVDSSPVAPVTDAVILSQLVDGVILVVHAGKTHRKAVMFARKQLENVNAPILGVVLNEIDVEKSTYGNYQYYRYGYETYGSPPKKEIEEEPSESPPHLNA